MPSPREVTAAGPGEAVFIRCDVSKVEEVEALVDATVARFGRLDCLVNNAGWHPPHKPIDDFTPDEFRDLFELNVMSVFAACRRALPHLRKTQWQHHQHVQPRRRDGPAPRHHLRGHQGRASPRSPRPWPWTRPPTTCA